MDVRQQAVVVPTKALSIEKGGAFIYVVKSDGVVEKRYVEVGPETGNNTIIERGLSSGERIVTEGTHKLRHGMKVQAVESAHTPSEALSNTDGTNAAAH